MKKLLSLLSVLTISGTAVPTTIAASPYQKEETILKRNKRWGEVQWTKIAQQWRNAELAYQRAGENFQRNQNHTAFSQAQQRFLQAQQSYNNSVNEWKNGFRIWNNQLAQERSQKWWHKNNSKEANKVEQQWVYDKLNQVANKLGVTVNTQKVNDRLQQKWNKHNRQKRDCATIFDCAFIFGMDILGNILTTIFWD